MSIRDLGEDLACITQQGKLQEIPGICHDLSEVIDEYARTRKVRRYEQECKGIPQGLIDLMSIPGLGPKTLALLRNLISGQRNVHCVEAESHEPRSAGSEVSLSSVEEFGRSNVGPMTRTGNVASQSNS